MRLFVLSGLYLIGACQPLSSEPTRYNHLALSAETIPVWADTFLRRVDSLSVWAISLILQRDRVSDIPEWVSGHRLALTAACELFSPRLLILETPADDTLFYPLDSTSQVAWQSALRSWLLDELLPFISTYPSLTQIAWGKGFASLPLPENFWVELLQAARHAAPHLQWGSVPTSSLSGTFLEKWDFIGLFPDTLLSEAFSHSLPAHIPLLYFVREGSPPPPHTLHLPNPILGYVSYAPKDWQNP